MELLSDLAPRKQGLHLHPFAKVICHQQVNESTWMATYQQSVPVHLIFPSGFASVIQSGDQVWIWDFDVKGLCSDKSALEIIVDLTNGTTKAIVHNRVHANGMALVELYAGMGSWTFAHKAMRIQGTPYLVEKDIEVAKCCAKTHNLPIIPVEQAFDMLIRHGKVPINGCIFLGEVENPKLWTVLSIIGIKEICLSPPCQPWSSVGKRMGLTSKDGRSWAVTFCAASEAGVNALVCETVPGFKSHEHAKHLIQFAKQCGYTMIVGNIIPVEHILPIVRSRWICVFIRTELAKSIDSNHQINVQNIRLPVYPDVGGLSGRDAFIPSFLPHERHEIAIPHEAKECLTDPAMVPSWWKWTPTNDPKDVWNARIMNPDGNLSGVMAAYGNQHTLDKQLLRDHGLCTTILPYEDDPDPNFKGRYYHPWEAAAALGWPAYVALPCDIISARHITGNGLTTLQAVVGIYQLHKILGSQTPFGELDSLKEICDRVIDARPSLTCMTRGVSGNFRVLQFVQDIQNRETTFFDPEQTNPHVKRQKTEHPCVPATVPFTIQEESRDDSMHTDVVPFPDHIPMRQITKDQIIMWLCDNIAKKPLDQKPGPFIPMAINAIGKTWVYVGWTFEEQQIQESLKIALPHLTCEQVDDIRMGGLQVHASTIPRGITSLVLDVEFRKLNIPIRIGTCDQIYALRMDATHTVADLFAIISTRQDVVVKDLQCYDGSILLDESHFVVSRQSEAFNIAWKPKMMKSVHLVKPIAEDREICVPPIHSDAVNTEGTKLIRFAARHPIWTTVRTIARNTHASIHDVAKGLFPDLVVDVKPIAYIKGEVVQNDTQICTVGEIKKFQIDLQSNRPIPIIEVHVMDTSREPECTVEQIHRGIKRWVKSPFRVRAREITVDPMQSLTEFAAAYFAQSSSVQTIMPIANAKLIDPRTIFRETCPEAVLEFRCCALPGGVKDKPEDIKKQLIILLKDKGVPGEKVGERAAGIIEKIGVEKVKNALGQAPVPCWNQLKSLANTAKVRMIHPDELKAFQRDVRQQNIKDKVSNEPNPKKPKTIEPETLDIGDMNIACENFQANGKGVNLIPINQFGKDACGLAIVTKDQVGNFLPTSVLSCDPLALLVIGYPAVPGHTLISVAATKTKGTPVMLPATLLNYGEEKIEYKMCAKTINIPEIKSVVIDFHIERDLTTDWTLTQNTLQFIGKHFPELRNGGTLSSWAIRPFDKNRKQVAHQQASSIHGFLRVSEDKLKQVLARSGTEGVFLTPKTETKQLDPRFAAVLLPGASFEDAKCKALHYKPSIGIVMIKKQFAVRVAKELLQEARAALSPESIFIPSGHSANTNARLWIMSQVKSSFAHDELTKGLNAAGWEATALKQTGAEAWLIAAESPPPAVHMSLNGNIVLIAEKERKNTNVHNFAKFEVKLPSTIPQAADDSMSVSTATSSATRFDDLKKELQNQINATIDERLKETNGTIEGVQRKIAEADQKIEAFEKNTALQFDTIKADQQALASTVQSTSEAVLGRMQSMFQQFQKETEKSFSMLQQHLENKSEGHDENKRPRQN